MRLPVKAFNDGIKFLDRQVSPFCHTFGGGIDALNKTGIDCLAAFESTMARENLAQIHVMDPRRVFLYEFANL